MPHGVLASSASMQYMRSTLEQVSMSSRVANPFVTHVAAVDYAGHKRGKMMTDYSTVLASIRDLDCALIASSSTHESQHMACLATAMAHIVPTIHIYDGVQMGRETTRVIDVLDQPRLQKMYQTVVDTVSRTASVLHLEVQAKKVLATFNEETGSEYGFFEYLGHPSAEAVLVTFGSNEASLASQVASMLSKKGFRVGSVNVRIYRPFIEEEFMKILPPSAKIIGVLGQVHNQQAVRESSVHSALYQDVISCLAFSEANARVDEIKYSRSRNWTPVTMAEVFQTVLGKPLLQEAFGNGTRSLQLTHSSTQQYIFWDLDDSDSAISGEMLARALSADSSHNVTMTRAHDNELQGGTVRVDIRKSSKSLEAYYPVESAHTVVVGEAKLLDNINLRQIIQDGGNLILKLSNVPDEEVEQKIPTTCRKTLAERGIRLFLVDLSATALQQKECRENTTMEVAFLRVALRGQESIGLSKLASLGEGSDAVQAASQDLENTLREIEVPKAWAEIEAEVNTNADAFPAEFIHNNFSGFFEKNDQTPTTGLASWQNAAKGLLFKEAYKTRPALRPDLSTRTYTVHVKENRRLTPATYDRNIFHIEFDLGMSGLKYEIGEALGIHPENDPSEVLDFIKFYGIEPDEVVEVASRNDPNILEERTVYQSLVQNIDIFGRPPKRFYEMLSEFASDPDQQRELRTLGGPEGHKEFQRRAEVDTITYADTLLEFSSAHPSFQDIIRLVAPLKRREYSIASCQAVTPTSVALMIVVVNWVDPKGRDRFGLATRYLVNLKPGTPVAVSVKPSVMKLPPSSAQPIVMAGLGTGLAPFRAFVQHRALQKSQGKAIGPVLLYMGARHQREEYCYGEEWEAYQDAGVITLLGRAFSRDQPQKIYIQDRMRQTIEDIVAAYLNQQGYFYLCGPTWPVPDVTKVLEEAVELDAKIAGKGKVDARKTMERFKDEGRYVLEVY